MPKCKSCLGSEVKEFLSKMEDSRIDSILAQVPDCPDDLDIVLCGSIRKRSAYQQFVSDCLKAKKLKGFDPKALGECAKEWRKQHGKL